MRRLPRLLPLCALALGACSLNDPIGARAEESTASGVEPPADVRVETNATGEESYSAERSFPIESETTRLKREWSETLRRRR